MSQKITELRQETQPTVEEEVGLHIPAEAIQPDHANLMAKAKELFPERDYIDRSMTLRMRAKWYEAIAKLRTTGRGWLMDPRIQRRTPLTCAA